MAPVCAFSLALGSLLPFTNARKQSETSAKLNPCEMLPLKSLDLLYAHLPDGLLCSWSAPDNTVSADYSQSHLLKFSLNQDPVGVGLPATEVIDSWVTARLTDSDRNLYYNERWQIKDDFTVAVEIACDQVCDHSTQSIVGDRYGFQPAPVPSWVLLDVNCATYPNAPTSRTFTQYAKHEWMDQRIYVNHGLPSQRYIDSLPDSYVELELVADIHGFTSDCGDIQVTDIEWRGCSLLSSSGPISN